MQDLSTYKNAINHIKSHICQLCPIDTADFEAGLTVAAIYKIRNNNTLQL